MIEWERGSGKGWDLPNYLSRKAPIKTTKSDGSKWEWLTEKKSWLRYNIFLSIPQQHYNLVKHRIIFFLQKVSDENEIKYLSAKLADVVKKYISDEISSIQYLINEFDTLLSDQYFKYWD